MINKVILVGNLGADPESRTANTGTMIAKLRIATTERQKDKEGNWSDHTEWHRVVVFGRTAENASKYLKKGRQVYVEGVLRTSKYTDKDGVERFSTEIIGNDLRFLGSGGGERQDRGDGGYGGAGGGGGASGGGGAGGGGASGGGGSSGGGGFQGGSDDDIPF